jgi:hypothetical protein
VITHGCSDTGLQITANSSEAGDAMRAAYNTVINCDSYENYDEANAGENADGFAAKLYIGPGNVFRGCRAWNNADDGWDLFAGALDVWWPRRRQGPSVLAEQRRRFSGRQHDCGRGDRGEA